MAKNMMHFDMQAQLDRIHRTEMEAAARKQVNSSVFRTTSKRGPVYGPALAGLGRVLVNVGEALKNEYGDMVGRGEQVMERFEEGIEQVRKTSENPTVNA